MIIIQLDSEQFSGLIQSAIRKVLDEFSQGSANQSEPDQFFTIQQAAAFLNLSVPTLYGKVHKAEIPVSKRGKRLYFSRQELTEWIKLGRKLTIAEIGRKAEQHLAKMRK